MSKTQPFNLDDLKPLSDPKLISAMLQQLRMKGAWVIPASLPNRIDRIPEQHQVHFFAKFFDPNPKGADMYHDNRMQGAQVGLKHSALVELWNAAGGRPVISAQVSDASDPSDPYFVKWKYTGEYREIGGIWTQAEGNKRIDLRTDGAQTKNMTDGMLSQQRSSIYEISESKAMSRMIRKALGIKASYTPEEAAQPFIVIRLMLVPDLKDPLQRAIYLADSMGASRALFGNPEFMRSLLMAAPVTEETDDAPGIEGRQQKGIAPGKPAELAEAAATPAAAEPLKPIDPKEYMMDFGAATEAQQLVMLDSLIDRKGYNRVDIPKAYNPKSAGHRTKFLERLLGMPDKPVTEVDPFL